MIDEIAFSGRLSYEDALKARRLFPSLRNLSFSFLVVLGVIVWFVLAIAVWIIRSIPTMTATEARSLICLFTIVLPILGCIVWFLHWVNSGDREKEYLARTRPINGTCSHDGVRLREAGVTVHVEWTALTGYGESDGMHFLMWGKEPFPLAPYMFQTPEDWDRARSLIRENLKPIAIRTRKAPSLKESRMAMTL